MDPLLASQAFSPTQPDSAGPCSFVSRCRLVDEMRMTVGKLSHSRDGIAASREHKEHWQDTVTV